MIYAALQGHSPPHRQTCLFFLIALLVTIDAVFHPESPCPTVFNYEGNEPEFDRWYGEVQLVSNDNLVGVVLNIRFDRVTHLLVSWTGEVTTEDNVIYSVIDLNQRLEAKIPFHSRFMVKFNGTRGSPRIKTLRLNGRQICPPEMNVVNELQQKPKVTTDKNHRVVTKRPDPIFPDTYPTTSYYQDFMTPTTPRHRTTTTEKYLEIEETPYNPNSNLKPPYQPSSSSVNKNKVSVGTSTYDNYDNGYSTGNTHVNRPSNNQDLENDRNTNYNRPSASNYSPPKNPSYEAPQNPNKNKPNRYNVEEETSYSSNVDRPVSPSSPKKPYNQASSSNYNPSMNPSNEGSYNSHSGSNIATNTRPSNKKPSNTDYDEYNGYNADGQSTGNSNKKPTSTSNHNYNEDDGYSNQGSQTNYNTEDKPRPTSVNTSNKKPSNGNYGNFDEDNSYSNPNIGYNSNNKPKQPDTSSYPNPNKANSGRPTGSSATNPSRPTHIEHIANNNNNDHSYSNTETNREDNRKPSSTNTGYESGVNTAGNGYSNVASNNGYNSGNSNSGYNAGSTNNGYNNGESNSGFNSGGGGGSGYNNGANNNGYNKGNENNYNSGTNNYPGNIPSDIDKTDNINIGDVQPAKSEKTVIITSIHKNTYVVPAGGNKEENGHNGNTANENSYDSNPSNNRVTTPKYNEFDSDSKPSVVTKPSNQNSKPSSGNANGGKKPSQTSKPNSNKDEQCGVISQEAANRVTPLVTNGQATARGQWPWHVALYKTDGINLTYICGGSLITKNIVVTAAHCVTKKPYDRPVDANTIVIYLGKYHLQQYSDDGGIQIKQVLEIMPFPTYNSSNYLGDIALLKMTSSAEYTSFVRPVCMWDSRVTELASVVDKEGTVIGWGYDEHDKASEELKMAKMPVVSQETCIYSNRPFFSQFTSNKTFCAGFRNGTSVCNGDSGGGMVFSRGNGWHLRGIVSISVAQSGLRKCDTKHYVVFTDVAKYLDWINKYVEKNKES